MNLSMDTKILSEISKRVDQHSDVESVENILFKQSMRNIASPVGIVTTRQGELRHGLTATAICSVSMDPPSMLVCVNRNASAERMIAESGVFAINMLTEQQHGIARLFSTPGLDPEGRFAEGEWHHRVTGSPILTGAVASFDCVIEQCIQWGTHNLYIGRVIATDNLDQDILLYKDGLFRQIEKNRF